MEVDSLILVERPFIEKPLVFSFSLILYILLYYANAYQLKFKNPQLVFQFLSLLFFLYSSWIRFYQKLAAKSVKYLFIFNIIYALSALGQYYSIFSVNTASQPSPNPPVQLELSDTPGQSTPSDASNQKSPPNVPGQLPSSAGFGQAPQNIIDENAPNPIEQLLKQSLDKIDHSIFLYDFPSPTIPMPNLKACVPDTSDRKTWEKIKKFPHYGKSVPLIDGVPVIRRFYPARSLLTRCPNLQDKRLKDFICAGKVIFPDAVLNLFNVYVGNKKDPAPHCLMIKDLRTNKYLFTLPAEGWNIPNAQNEIFLPPWMSEYMDVHEGDLILVQMVTLKKSLKTKASITRSSKNCKVIASIGALTNSINVFPVLVKDSLMSVKYDNEVVILHVGNVEATDNNSKNIEGVVYVADTDLTLDDESWDKDPVVTPEVNNLIGSLSAYLTDKQRLSIKGESESAALPEPTNPPKTHGSPKFTGSAKPVASHSQKDFSGGGNALI